MDAQRQDGFDFENVMNSTLGEGYEDFDKDRIMFDNEGIPNLGNYVFGKRTFLIVDHLN